MRSHIACVIASLAMASVAAVVGPAAAGRGRDARIVDLGSPQNGPVTQVSGINAHNEVIASGWTPDWAAWRTFVWTRGVHIDLGTLGGRDTYVSGINDRGDVVGHSQTTSGSGIAHAFLWHDGTMTDLGTLGGDSSSASAINDDGEIVGYSVLADGASHAFLYTHRRMLDLGEFEPYDINDRGQIVGVGANGVVVWTRGRFVELGTTTLGSQCYPREITDRGDVLGLCGSPYDGGPHTFYWNGHKAMLIGSLGGNATLPGDINERGQIVGFSETTSGQFHAYLWERGRMLDLGAAGGISSQANGINDRGEIVGSTTTADGLSHATLWQRGSTVDLGTLGGDYTSGDARAITDAGSVVGTNATATGESRAVLWTLPNKR